MSMPVFLGVVKVLPSRQVEDSMHRDEEIEKIGMEIAMKYESEVGAFQRMYQRKISDLIFVPKIVPDDLDTSK